MHHIVYYSFGTSAEDETDDPKLPASVMALAGADGGMQVSTGVVYKLHNIQT